MRQQQKVPDPRQDALSRAMNGVRWVTPAQRQQIIQTAQRRYAAAVKAARRAERSRR